MSGVQFGTWNLDGRPADPEFIKQAARLTSKYAADGEALSVDGAIALLFQPFHTTKESSREQQPLVSATGVVLIWDGRLDNRDDLVRRLHLSRETMNTDARIVLSAYERWGKGVFVELIGDWALTIWDPIEQALLLAKDFAGARHLFYKLDSNRITWSTVLDPLVLLAEGSVEISEEFVAGYLSTYPATHLTPYVGINAVPASTFILVRRGRASTQEHWRFLPSQHIRYRTDAEYEEHFRHVFGEAVRRRLRSSSTVLAELSGGVDSSSIVCMADQIIARSNVKTPRLDTVSYYDDDEPNWNERPYFSLVEQKRGREGYHIDVGGTKGALVAPQEDFFFPLPGYDRLTVARSVELNRCLLSSQSRVLLRGIGGDEFLGGRPTPIPELQDLTTQFRAFRFARQLWKFSLDQRRPWSHLAFDVVEEFLPQPVRRLYKRPQIAPWLTSDFVRRNADVFWADAHRTRLFGPSPSFQSGLATLDHLRRQLNCYHPEHLANRSTSYPYFDRDLLVFLFAVPREQLVRPGQRRSLMRRSLANLVPSEILARKRKAYVVRRPITLIADALPEIRLLLQSPRLVEHGWMDPAMAAKSLESARQGKTEQIIPMLSALKLELWLRGFEGRRKSACSAATPHTSSDHRALRRADAVC